MIKLINFLALSIVVIPFIVSCAAPLSPEVKKVYIPVKCEIPKLHRPVYDGTFESAKKLTQYYLTVENLLFQCAKESD